VQFSNEDNALNPLIDELYQFKEYGSWKLLAEFPVINWNNRGLHSWGLLKKNWETGSNDKGTGAADRSMRILKRMWPLTTVDELVVSQEDQTHQHIRLRDRSNTFCCHRDHSLRSGSEISEVSEMSLCARTDCSYC